MTKCCIQWCSARKNRNRPQLTLHKLPNNEALKKKWLDIIGRENINPNIKTLFVCSLHFEETSFNRTLDVITLRDGAMPSASLVSKGSTPAQVAISRSTDTSAKDAPEGLSHSSTSFARDTTLKEVSSLNTLPLPSTSRIQNQSVEARMNALKKMYGTKKNY